MKHHLRRGASALASLAVTAAGLAVLGVTAAPPSHAAPVDVDDATFTWGLSGYAQKGIFGPWTFHDLSGNVTQLVGTVTTPPPAEPQTEYLVDPVPATSMPASDPQQTPNAVKFTLGEGTADAATGAASISWDGSYTVNAYPPQFGAPDEIYSDPQLTVDEDGDGQVTMNFALGEGQDMNGNPVPAQDFGRLTLLAFSGGAPDRIDVDGFRYTPDYQGVEVTVPDGSAQNRTCTTDGGATGWWGSWPAAFVNTVPSSIRPHFYSTGCAGMQDNKPPLPVDVDFGAEMTPTVAVSDTTILPSGAYQVTVTGSGFDPAKAIGTRPPLSGQPAGTYVVFGVFADSWRPSQSAPSANRKVVTQQWATPNQTAPGTANLQPDGTFSTTLTISKEAADTAAGSFVGNYGVYTYPGSGAAEPAFETFTPITFVKATPTVTLTAPDRRFGAGPVVDVEVEPGDGSAEGTVTLRRGGAVVGTRSLAAGATRFTLSSALPAGSHALTATFSGNDTTASATDAGTVRVVRAVSSTRFALTRPAPNRAGSVRIVVSSPTTTPTGRATVQVRRSGNVVRTATGTLRRGSVTLAIPRQPRGTYRVVVTYPGTANVGRSAKETTFTVR